MASEEGTTNEPRRFLSGTTTWRRLTVLVIVVYVVFATAIYFGADRLIFVPADPGYRAGPDVLMIPTGDHQRIAAYSRPVVGARVTVLYFHGNEEDLGGVGRRLETFRRLGLSSLAIDYRGYGRSDGTASEDNAYRDADAAYAYLTDTLNVPPSRIMVLRRSLGGAVAIDLASRKPVGGLVVESTFTTAYRVAIPFPILPFDQFESIDKIDEVDCPVAIMHGTADEVIDVGMGRELFAAARQPKVALWVEGATHGDLLDVAGERYAATLNAIVEQMR